MDNKRFLVHVAVWLISMLVKAMATDVCVETVTAVSKCPRNTSEYNKQASEKMCSKACRKSEGDSEYIYHCMLDSTDGQLKEICAIQKYFFGYCPVYDPIGQKIQKDESRPCKSSSSRTYYTSSDLFFCDLTNCLKSHAYTKSDSTIGTTDEMTKKQTPDGENISATYIWISITIGMCLIGIIGSVIIIFIWKKQQSNAESSDCFQIVMPGCLKSPRKENQGNKENEKADQQSVLLIDGHVIVV